MHPANNSENYITIEQFSRTMSAADARWTKRQPMLRALVETYPLLLFGFGGKGQALARHVKRRGEHQILIFDRSPEKRALARSLGFEVLEHVSPQVWRDHAVIVAACQHQLEQRDEVGETTIFYQEASWLFDAPHLESSAREFRAYTLGHLSDFHALIGRLEPGSRATMLAVIAFRLSLDPGDLSSVRRPNPEMWLDVPRMHRSRSYGTVLDVGAFDGDTLSAFKSSFGCERGIAVEANTTLFPRIRSIGENYARGIEVLPIAAWSHATQLRVQELRSGMVQVFDDPEGELLAAPLDHHVQECIDLVKMDIEGAEQRAIDGASKLLNRWKPDLAIAAYHRPEDVLTLYDSLGRFGYHDDHSRWYFGHYSDCLDDSILYVLRHQIETQPRAAF